MGFELGPHLQSESGQRALWENQIESEKSVHYNRAARAAPLDKPPTKNLQSVLGVCCRFRLCYFFLGVSNSSIAFWRSFSAPGR